MRLYIEEIKFIKIMVPYVVRNLKKAFMCSQGCQEIKPKWGMTLVATVLDGTGKGTLLMDELTILIAFYLKIED